MEPLRQKGSSVASWSTFTFKSVPRDKQAEEIWTAESTLCPESVVSFSRSGLGSVH